MYWLLLTYLTAVTKTHTVPVSIPEEAGMVLTYRFVKYSKGNMTKLFFFRYGLFIQINYGTS